MNFNDTALTLQVLVMACPALLFLPITLWRMRKTPIERSQKPLFWSGIACYGAAPASYVLFYFWILHQVDGEGSGIMFILVVPVAWGLSLLGLALTLRAINRSGASLDPSTERR